VLLRSCELPTGEGRAGWRRLRAHPARRTGGGGPSRRDAAAPAAAQQPRPGPGAGHL